MLLPITTKQKEILLLLYRFRFLSRTQIQTLLKHKDSRRINEWLKDLTNKNYTGRIYEKKLGINDPAIYFISRNGIKFLKSLEECEGELIRKLYQETRRSKIFVNQCILIADINMNLRKQNAQGFEFYTQSDFPSKGKIRELLPSFAYVKEIDKTLMQYPCEIFKTGMPRFAIRARIAKYLEFFKPDEQSNVYIIFICPNEIIQKFVKRFTERLIDEDDREDIKFEVITYEEAKIRK